MRTVTALVTLRVLAKIDEGQEVQQVLKEAAYSVDDTCGSVMEAQVLEVTEVVLEDSR